MPDSDYSYGPGVPDDLAIIEPGIPIRDGCPVLRRVKAFVSQEGVAATLRFTYLDGQGNAIDLSDSALPSDSASASTYSEELTRGEEEPAVLVRFAEFTGYDAKDTWSTVVGTVVDAANGVVQAAVPKDIYGQSGIYTVSWGYIRRGLLALAQSSVLSVERTLFGFSTKHRRHTRGSPTLGEIRMQLMDSDPGENVLLDAVEFNDDQILQALAKPIHDFNDSPPPLSAQFDTRNFPWRSQWIDATLGYLYRFAAANYRRNHLAITGGGKQLDYLNREREYLAISQQQLQEWKEWLLAKKVEINTRGFVGQLGSDYSRPW